MNTRIYSAVLVLMTVLSTSISAQTDFFWSTFDLNSGAANSDLKATYEQGDTGSLFLYFSTNGPSDSNLSVGGFLDVATSMNGVIEFTRAETFDFTINVGGTPIGNRWLDDMGGGGSAGETGDVMANFIDEWNAFTVTGGQGILESNNGQGVFLDEGYDAGADAFLFGVVDFTVVGSMGSSVDLITSVGDGMVVDGGTALDPEFGNATINVTGIPEPTTVGLFAVGFAGVAARRRRS